MTNKKTGTHDLIRKCAFQWAINKNFTVAEVSRRIGCDRNAVTKAKKTLEICMFFNWVEMNETFQKIKEYGETPYDSMNKKEFEKYMSIKKQKSLNKKLNK